MKQKHPNLGLALGLVCSLALGSFAQAAEHDWKMATSWSGGGSSVTFLTMIAIPESPSMGRRPVRAL